MGSPGDIGAAPALTAAAIAPTPCLFFFGCFRKNNRAKSLQEIVYTRHTLKFNSHLSPRLHGHGKVRKSHSHSSFLLFFVGFHLSLSSLPVVFSSRTRATRGAPQNTVFCFGVWKHAKAAWFLGRCIGCGWLDAWPTCFNTLLERRFQHVLWV